MTGTPAPCGPLLFARYAFPPNVLGYCGPDDAHALLEYAAAGTSDAGLAALARRFDGAWPYLALIAAATGRTDPLDPAVVEAYWIGSPLLERVPAALLAANLDERFAHRIGRSWAELATLAVTGGRAHHNFHVFAVYPWVGMLRAGRVSEPLHVLDSCRVSWGTVEAVTCGVATVRSRRLVWTGHALDLGPPQVRQAAVSTGGYALARDVRVGDHVALHWDWVCDVLDPARHRMLRHYTETQLRLVNHTLRRPVAAAVLD